MTQLGRRPARWIATPAVAAELSDGGGHLVGLPVEVGALRSEWGLQLLCEPA